MTGRDVCIETAQTITFVLTAGQKGQDGQYMSETAIMLQRSRIDNLLKTAGATVFGRGEILGQWDGVSELTDLWQGTISGHAARLIQSHLSDLAHSFDQFAYGWIVQCDQNTLIEAS